MHVLVWIGAGICLLVFLLFIRRPLAIRHEAKYHTRELRKKRNILERAVQGIPWFDKRWLAVSTMMGDIVRQRPDRLTPEIKEAAAHFLVELDWLKELVPTLQNVDPLLWDAKDYLRMRIALARLSKGVDEINSIHADLLLSDESLLLLQRITVLVQPEIRAW